MDANVKVNEQISEEAKSIVLHSSFSFEDASSSLERSLRYFMDCGDQEPEAWDKARELVAMAALAAQTSGFSLRGMVDYILFSYHHRVKSWCGF